MLDWPTQKTMKEEERDLSSYIKGIYEIKDVTGKVIGMEAGVRGSKDALGLSRFACEFAAYLNDYGLGLQQDFV